MFQITKLSKDSRDFISELSLSGRSKELQTSLAVARVLANDIPLPSAPVESITSFYSFQCRINVEDILNTINEICLLDVSTVLDYTIKFYKLRYDTCNPNKTIVALNKETAIVDFFGISSVIDDVAIKAISEDPIKITDLVNKFVIVKQELKTQQ